MDADSVTTTTAIGAGQFGTVYRGNYSGTDVAVKKIPIPADVNPEEIRELKIARFVLFFTQRERAHTITNSASFDRKRGAAEFTFMRSENTRVSILFV